MKLLILIGVLGLTLILRPSAKANNSNWTVVHLGECSKQEIAQGFRTGVRWYNGGHAGPELREVCFRPNVSSLKNGNTRNSTHAFISSGVASIAWTNAKKLAIKQMWENAQTQCEHLQPVRISEIYIIDAGTFIAARAYFQCMQH